jgi:hypothetical protein
MLRHRGARRTAPRPGILAVVPGGSVLLGDRGHGRMAEQQ